MSEHQNSSAPKSVLGSAGYYDKSLDSLPVGQPVVVEQRQESPLGSGETISQQWGDFDD
ncbi:MULTISPECIES: hypothetical protein [Rhodococcus]|uniref:hypothetical protein n=1 Tax=Rhodococcus TaxID=1827 RepID=UPI0012927318|nr:hypothetical protein [Rhodococcus erythropolis]MCW2298420.1 hypothetical protein [Rhodococcus erythropolis]